MQLRLSSKHPKTDICDYHAKIDRYGLGPGVYPKAEAPKPPFHPFCGCRVVPRLSVRPQQPPKFNPKAERAFLNALPAKDARAIAGSVEKLARAKAGESLEAIYNEGKDELYRWKRVGEVVNENQPIDDPGKGPDRGRLRTRPVGLSGLLPEQAKALSGRELELARRQETEKAYVIAQDGTVVVHREGTEDRIVF